jgi:hypothetical protein
MAIRFAAKEPSAEPVKAKKGKATEALPEFKVPAATGDDVVAAPVPAAGDLFGSEPKKASRGRKKK